MDDDRPDLRDDGRGTHDRPKASVGPYLFGLVFLQAFASFLVICVMLNEAMRQHVESVVPALWGVLVWGGAGLVVFVIPVAFTVIYGRRGRWTPEGIFGWSLVAILLAGLIGFITFFGGCLYELGKHPI